MKNHIFFSFEVRNRGNGNALSGKQLTREIPDFNFEEFRKSPNAEEFMRKAYFSAVKKIMREAENHINGTETSDLDSYESIIARSLVVTKKEIIEWEESRDWSKATEIKNPAKSIPYLKKQLPSLSDRNNPFEKERADQVAKIVAAVADKPDRIADYLFTTLTLPRVRLSLDDL